MAENKLLGNHKPSQEWYTPDHVWNKVFNVFGFEGKDEELAFYSVFDPCPIRSTINGLQEGWSRYQFIYCNPPTPAAPWALKAIETVQQNPETVIIFACFSEAVIWQVNDLLNYPVCWVRNRISWIDGNEWIKAKKGERACDYSFYKIIDGSLYIPNPNYLKPAKSPRNYNAFVLLSHPDYQSHQYYESERRFCKEFSDLGTVQLSREIYTNGNH